MTAIKRTGSRHHDDAGHGVSAYLTDVQIRSLLEQAERDTDDDLARFYRAVLAKRRAERQECGVTGHLAKCSCAAYEQSVEGA